MPIIWLSLLLTVSVSACSGTKKDSNRHVATEDAAGEEKPKAKAEGEETDGDAKSAKNKGVHCVSDGNGQVCVVTSAETFVMRPDNCKVEKGDTVIDENVCLSSSCKAAKCKPTACKNGAYFAACNASCVTISYFQEPCASVQSSPINP